MSTSTVYCYELVGDIAIVSSIDGQVTNVVCPKFDRLTFGCEIKTMRLGFFSAVAGRVPDRALGTRTVCCEFTDPAASPIARRPN